jgi:hypothetical protein
MITFSRIVYGMRTISLLNVEKPTDNKISRVLRYRGRCGFFGSDRRRWPRRTPNPALRPLTILTGNKEFDTTTNG